ncbi:MAG TPA: sialidase family protein [Terriglobales bacterium]|nr:sialidase family protein [Terriglobales bacterium]
MAGDESQSRLQLQFSRDGGDTFGEPIILTDPNAKVRGGGENSPVLATNVQADIYAAWFQSVAGNTQLMVKAVDPNPGKPVSILDADRNSQAYAGFPTLAATHAGDVYVAWLDERDKAEGSSSVYFSRSTDHGVTFSRNMRIAGSACDCCRPQIYVAPSGDIYLAWRQVFAGDVRDMVLAHSNDGGKTFSQPVRVAVDNWVLHACPDVGPAIGASNGRLYVAWYSEGQERPGIRLAISKNGGASFARPQIVSADVLDATHPRLSVSEDGRVLLTFQGRPAHEDTKWRSNQAFIVGINGEKFTHPIQATNSEHSVHDPDVLAGTAGRLFLAWTESVNDRNQAVLSRGWMR